MSQSSKICFLFEAEHLNRYRTLMLALAQRVLTADIAISKDAALTAMSEIDLSQQFQRGISLSVISPLLEQMVHHLQADAAEASSEYEAYLATFCSKLDELGAYARTQERLPRFNDGFGHTRPIYWPLLVQLTARIVRETTRGDLQTHCLMHLQQAANHHADDATFAHNQTAMAAWLALSQCATAPDLKMNPSKAVQRLAQIIEASGPAGELHVFDESEQLLDTWWYNELVGLHALLNAAILDIPCVTLDRVGAMARHHVANIQPDHVTSQPWGCAAFVCIEQAGTFADQQLHDAATELHAHPQMPAWVHAMLLVDGAMTLRQFRKTR